MFLNVTFLEFKEELLRYTLDYTEKLAEFIIEARRISPVDLIEHVQNHTTGNFNDKKVLILKNFIFLYIFIFQVEEYMEERRRQMSIINIFYQKTLGQDTPQLNRDTSADISRAILTEEYVLVLIVPILPDPDQDNFKNFDVNKRKDQWYNKKSSVGEIR